ncbi:glycerophosphodiester phosphodiesterase family protein [Psychromonas aquimarina]|uniref:glycerophosphodiester phosphodiesterase family protein n=1 Tax=Psychromonas aquimarina TaxID=444919 RepID=UPI00041BFB25|nr:glycerophosphodiester phosphodiesterase family protein [Psychromonas aquimarina]
MNKTLFKALAVGILAVSSNVIAGERVDQIIERLENANDHRDHVMIVAHRGLWTKNAKPVYPEGSIYAIEKTIELGVEAVELDIRMTKDGVFVVMHDETLDRTTNCHGEVTAINYDDLKECKLVITDNLGEQRTQTEYRVPALEEALKAIDGEILVNLDNKVGVEYFPAMFEMAKKLGVDHQILATINQNDESQRKEATNMVSQFESTSVHFLTNIYDSHADLNDLQNSLAEYKPNAVQVRNYHEPDGPLTMDGGIFLSSEALELANKYNTHLWINTLYTYRKDAGLRSGGRGDEMAIYANLPSEVYGFWARKGITMIQTDEPEIAAKWLEENGYRKPYKK